MLVEWAVDHITVTVQTTGSQRKEFTSEDFTLFSVEINTEHSLRYSLSSKPTSSKLTHVCKPTRGDSTPRIMAFWNSDVKQGCTHLIFGEDDLMANLLKRPCKHVFADENFRRIWRTGGLIVCSWPTRNQALLPRDDAKITDTRCNGLLLTLSGGVQ